MKHTRRPFVAICLVLSLTALVIWLSSSRLTTGNAAPPLPVLDLSDDFNDNSLDQNKWTIMSPASPAVVSEQGQVIQIAIPASTATYNGISSATPQDMRDKTMEVEVVQPTSQAGWAENSIQVALDGQNYYQIGAGAGSIVFRSVIAGVNDQTVLNYDMTAYRFWGIRNDQNTNTISFQTSPDGVTWTTRKRVTSGFSLSGVYFYVYAGAWGTGNSNPGVAKYDNFQVVDSSSRSINVALAVNGAVATASSMLSLGYQPSSTINGDHKGVNWGSNGGWADASPGSFPDWVQVDFEGNKTINEIDVFSAQDNYTNPAEPTETMTFNLYGLSGYAVQYWNGTTWQNVPGGSVTGNNLVWRKFTFTPLTTSKIRVLTSASVDGYSRIAEVEAYTTVVHPVAAQWQFDEGSGTTVNDSTGYGSIGTAQNATWTAGRVGPGALDFNGTSSSVTVNSAAPLVNISNNFTLSFWAYPRSTHEIDPEVIGGAAGVSGERYVFGPNWYSNGDAGAGVSVGTNGVSVYEHAATYMPATLVYQGTLSGWTHIVVVYKNKQPKLYINGVLVRTGLTSPKNSVHIQPWNLGGTSYGYFNGMLDEVCVYKDSFTPADVQALYATYQSANNGGTMSLLSLASGPSSSIRFFKQVNGTDIASFGVGGLRGNGAGTLWVANMPTTIRQAFLYWHGSNNSVEGNLGGTLFVNGVQVQGTFIGKSADNAWGYPNSVAWRADITSLVNPTPNKSYLLSNFESFPFFNPNGASLIILYSNGNSGDDVDVSIYDGNDGNSHSSFDSDGWFAPLTGFEYGSGQAILDMHVADGQFTWNDPDVALNNQPFLTGNWFQGSTVPWGDGFFRTDALWDIRAFNITSYLHTGINDVTITSPPASPTPPLKDGLNLIVAVVRVPAVHEVKSVSWETIDSLVDDNPNTGGGKRIFPDWQAPRDTVNRRRVRVKAQTTLGSGQTVFFRSFDVDDPSSDTSPIDTNGSAGDDNRGTPKIGTLNVASAQTDANGVATVEFTTTMHPGDNFMVAASKDQTYLNGVVVNGTGLRDSSNNNLPTLKAKATPMLTVWRQLHIEVDSMDRVTGNAISGGIRYIEANQQIGPCPPKSFCPPDRTQHMVGIDKGVRADYGRFVNGEGRMIISGITYVVSWVTPLDDNSAIVAIDTPNQVTPTGTTFTLVDDDDFNSNDTGNLRDDEGEDVTALSDTFSLMQNSDDPAKNIYAAAYIRPVYDGAGPVNNTNNQSDILFDLNVPTGPSVVAQIGIGQSSADNENDSYWVAYIQVAYQGDENADLDLNNEPGLGGITVTSSTADFVHSEADVPVGGDGSLIYIETLRDLNANKGVDARRRAAPHEVGHQMGITGDNELAPWGIMNPNGANTFDVDHLNLMRWRVHSPGH
jgi:hypothetical protein